MKLSRFCPTVFHTGIIAGLFISAMVFAAPSARAQEAITPPAGWHKEANTSGEGIAFSPNTLPAGKVFTLTIRKPASTGSESLRDWFSHQIDADVASLGAVVSNGQIMQQAKLGGLTCSKGVRDSSGRPLIVLYVAQPAAGSEARLFRIVSSSDPETYKGYMPGATTIIVPLLRRGMASGHSPATLRGNSGQGVTAPSAGSSMRGQIGAASSALKDRRLTYTTKPGAGLKSSQIAGIYAREESETGVGGAFYNVYEPLIAFKNGTYYRGFDVPPADFNLSAAHAARPLAWGKWRRVGGKVQIFNEKRGWIPEEWLGPFSGGSSSERLSGTYSSISGGGNTAFGGGTMIASVHDFTFFPDGRFTTGATTSVSSHEPLSNVGIEAGSKSHTGGTYKIDGYTLEFRYKDGRVDRRSFVFMDDKKNGGLYLNGVAYLKDKR